MEIDDDPQAQTHTHTHGFEQTLFFFLLQPVLADTKQQLQGARKGKKQNVRKALPVHHLLKLREK